MSVKYRKTYDKKNSENVFDEEEGSSNYLDIWTVNPFHKDINLKQVQYKIMFVAILLITTIFFIITISPQINYMVFVLAILLMLLYYENFFNFLNNLFKRIQGLNRIDPHKDLIFLTLESDLETLLIINKKNSLILSTRIFEVKVLPENVHPTLNHFLKALYTANIKYSYQVVQTPIIYQNHDFTNSVNNETSIYFSVFEQKRGIITKRTVNNLVQTTQKISKIFKSHLSSNFHHTKFSLLGGNELISAIRTIFCGINIGRENDYEYNSEYSEFIFLCVLKLIIIAIIEVIFSYIAVYQSISWWLILILDIILAMILISIWWEDLLFFISKFCFLNQTSLSAINPFIDIKFFYGKKSRDSLFMLFQNNLLIGTKIFNLKHSFQKSFIYSDKFFRELNNHKIPFTYTLQATPLLPEDFGKRCKKYLNEKGYSDLDRIFGITTLDGESTRPIKNDHLVFKNWLSMRSGIWKTMLTISTMVYKYITPSNFNDFPDIEEELTQKSDIVINAFEDNCLNLTLTQLHNQKLMKAFQFVSLKSSLFKAQNTKLFNVYFQGKTLLYLNSLSNEFKKGLETKIAAEFNTPLHLKNDIVIGKTVNTEFLENEVDLGFTYDQVKHLLITNGLSEQREYTIMKIVAELIKLGRACVIFDYSGKWSKLISYFKNSYLEDTFLYFKLGRSFRINLTKSEIDYDEKNVEYLNLFFDVFALAFKEQKRIVDLLKESISKNQKLSLEDMALDQEMEKEIIKQNEYNALLTLLHGFIDWRALFATKALKSPQEIKTIDFIRNDKTVIIDLSLVDEMSQKNFISFIILSKFIHYLKNSEDYHQKIIIIPDVDLFFDANYIDNYNSPVDFGKISKFIDPFLEKGCGFIFSANQIQYLHSHLVKYFPNIITFNATDSREIAVLKNQMNLQELQGTGYYSSKRNNTYQIDYLKNLRDNEVLVKRADIYQPFPGEIDYYHLQIIPAPSRDLITDYMKKQGYDYTDHEKKILAGAKKTLFEKDLGVYSSFTEEIIKFLDAISKVDKVGGLYERRLKEELLAYIYPKASLKFQNKKQINNLRDSIFKILKTHGYLVESHPARAGGRQTTRTCYRVGDTYHRALEDYYQIKKGVTPKILVETIKKESNNISNISIGLSQKDIINEDKIKIIIEKKLSDLVWISYQLYKLNKRKQYQTALDTGKEVILKFITEIYDEYLRIESEKPLEIAVLSSFIDYLAEQELLPFNGNMLQKYIDTSNQLSRNASNTELNANELEYLINEFYRAIRFHINSKYSEVI